MDKILSKKAVANLVGVEPRTIDRYVKQGLIPYVHVNRHILFSFNRLCQWLLPEVAPIPDYLEPEEKVDLERKRLEADAEERFHVNLIRSDRLSKKLERAEKTLTGWKRLLELQEKEAMNPEEKLEATKLEDSLNALGREGSIELEKEYKDFRAFFSGLEEAEAKKIFQLLESR